MLKIKLFAALGVLSLVALVANVSPVFVSKAKESDAVLQKISGYKTWTKVTGGRIKFTQILKTRPDAASTFQIDGASGSE